MNNDKIAPVQINKTTNIVFVPKNIVIENSNLIMYENKKSPDLFEEDNPNNESDEALPKINTSVSHINKNNSILFDDILLRNMEQRDHEILLRIHNSLSGLPPPPSVTIMQIDMFITLAALKEQIFNFFDDWEVFANNVENVRNALFKPSHSYSEIKNMKWPNILNVNHHGLCYNLSPTTEKIEQLCLSVVDRYVRAETSSSFIYYSPSIEKEENNKIRIQSPSTRLSHLAKRRSIFSSTHLESSLQMPQQINACTRQILLDSTKSEIGTSFLKSSGVTVKTHTPSARNFIFQIDPSTAGTSLKTSKRAIFQRNPNEILFAPKISFQTDVVNPIEKSKHALVFSPDSASSQDSKQVATHDFSPLLLKSLKRKCCKDIMVGNSTKKFRNEAMDIDNRTSRTLMFNSKSFCIGSLSSVSNKNEVKGKSIFRASSNTTFICNGFSESHKKKLLWAVSQALLNKQIVVDHPKFKQYASVLARAVKRIFVETPSKCGSASDIMLSLAKKYAIWVINGKTTDEVYLHEKFRMNNNKLKAKITGYIAPDDYEKFKNRSNSSVLFLKDAQSLIGCTQLSPSSSRFEYGNQISLDVADNNSIPNENQQIQLDNRSQNSSSKNNLSGIALRENFDSERRHSMQKYYAGKNTSPYSECEQLSLKKLTTISDTNGLKAKRHISFDN